MGGKRQYIVISLLLISGVLNNYVSTRVPHTAELVLPITIPFVKAGWQGTPFFAPGVIIGRNEISREYRFDNGRPLNLLVLSRESEPHDPRLCYGGLGWQLTDAPRLSTSSGNVVMAGLRGRMRNEEILVYYGYTIGARIIPDGIERKYYEIIQRLTYGYELPIFVEVTTVVPQGEIKTAESSLRKFLEDMEEHLVSSEG